jgi:CBS domain-containing protein
MTNVRALLNTKGSELWQGREEAPLIEAIELMAAKDIGAVVVLDGECLVGILSERDCVRRAMLQGKDPHVMKVCEVMTPTVIFARPEFTLRACMAIMTENHIRHLPVLEEGVPIGLITLGDVVKEIIRRQVDTIHQLENIVSGTDQEP